MKPPPTQGRPARRAMLLAGAVLVAAGAAGFLFGPEGPVSKDSWQTYEGQYWGVIACGGVVLLFGLRR